MAIIREGEVSTTNIELIRDEIEEDKDILSFVVARKIDYTVPVKKEYNITNNNFLAIKSKINADKAPKFKLNLKSINSGKNQFEEEKSNHFNRSISGNNSNNNSERLLIKHKAKTDRIKIAKMRFGTSNSTFINKSGINYKVNKKKNENVTDRIKLNRKCSADEKSYRFRKTFTGNTKLNEKPKKLNYKSKTQRDFHAYLKQ